MLFHYRVFAAVIVTARNVTYALASAPDVSQGFECGKKISSLLKSTNNSIAQEHTKQVKIILVVKVLFI